MHARASDLEPVLVQVLSAIGEKTEVVADDRGNRLLVRGPLEAHRLTHDLVQRLDRPDGGAAPPAAAASGAAAQPVLLSIPYGGQDAAAVAARVQAGFPANSGVRIAVDRRTAQMLVLAPPDLHAEIRRRLAAASPATANFAAQTLSAAQTQPQISAARPLAAQQRQSTLGRPPSGPPAAVATVQLSRLRPEQLETELSNLWGDRLSPLAKTNDEYSSYLLRLENDARLEVHANRRTGQVVLRGPAEAQEMAARLIRALDAPAQTAQGATRVVPVRTTPPEQLHQAIAAFSLLDKPAVARPDGAGSPRNEPAAAVRAVRRGGIGLVAQVFQPKRDGAATQLAQQPAEPAEPAQPAQPGDAGQQPPAAPGAEPPPEEGETGLLGPVQIEFLEGLDAIIIRGNQRDVERVMKIIEEIERLSVETVPVIEVYQLQHVGSEALATIIKELYDQVLSPRSGNVSITALVKPNALLLIGRAESVKVVTDLIKQLDQAVGPETQFEVFRLKHASAATAQQTVSDFYTNRTGLGPKIIATADIRSNSLIVQASPRDLLEVGALLKRIDTATSDSVNELRVFSLQYTQAVELAPILQDAVNSQTLTGGGGGGQSLLFPGQPGQAAQPGQPGQGGQGQGGQRGGAAAPAQRSAMLRFLTVDAKGKRRFSSGILTDFHVTADARGNTLLVSAPADSLELIAALIAQLDHPPATISQIKVFTIVNGDAQNLVDLLETLFGQPPTQRGGAGGFGAAALQQLQASAESSLVPVRFSVDLRTNSIIASGSAGDLNVVEAILLRLDESDIRQRKTKVYRLKNAPALDVSNAVNEYLRSERTVQQAQPGLLSPFQQIEREVVVVPELVSNSLIVSATPRFYEEITKLVEELDKRPPMVMIQVLIGEVTLNSTDEFGVELGLQDSVLFDRSLIGDLVTVASSGTQAVAGGGTITTNTQTIVGASNVPGFQFNSNNVGNSASDRALTNSSRVGAQGLSNFSVGRINNDLGFGGLVLSAGSESVNVLLRALQECRRLEVLSRPQVMTLDNQSAYVQVGQTVPRINGTTTNATGQLVNTLNDVAVGLVLGVTPRISPDGLVVMEIDAERSQVGPESEGIPISVAPDGAVLRSPRIDRILAQTTVSAVSGQTVVLGGLITKQKTDIHRRAPILSSIPVLGHLFRYDQIATRRTELLIIMTPHVVRNEEDATKIRQVEAARMSWCLADVEKMHGEMGLRTRGDEWYDAETTVVYPDMNPLGEPVAPKSMEPKQATPPATGPSGPMKTNEDLPAPPSGPAIHEAHPTSAVGPVVGPAVGASSRRVPRQPAANGQRPPALLDPESRTDNRRGPSSQPTAMMASPRDPVGGGAVQSTQYQSAVTYGPAPGFAQPASVQQPSGTAQPAYGGQPSNDPRQTVNPPTGGPQAPANLPYQNAIQPASYQQNVVATPPGGVAYREPARLPVGAAANVQQLPTR
jgi:general secretion pathway protein D